MNQDRRRFANPKNHKSILEKRFACLYTDEDNFKGYVALIKIDKVLENWYVEEEQRCILAPNYSWLEIYRENSNYCITVIFDDNNNIVEYYIDIAKDIGVENGIPYENDLFLDVVIAGKDYYLLDEDDLEEALENHVISREEYDFAYKIANNIMNNINEENIERLEKFSRKNFDILIRNV